MKNKEINIPEAYGSATIGTAVNYVTREVLFSRHAFDMSALNSVQDALQDTTPHAVQTTRAHAYSRKRQNAWSHSSATKLEARTLLTKSSYDHEVSNSNSHLATADGLSLIMGMAYQGYAIRMTDDVDEDDLYGCATPQFKQALEALAAAGDEKAFQEAYDSFVKKFGHGFVSGLKLICCACAWVEMTDQAVGTRQQQQQNTSIASSVAFEKAGGGAAHSSGWAKDQSASGSKGAVHSDWDAWPAQSPCATWAQSRVDDYDGEELGTIQAEAPDVPAGPPSPVQDPKIPTVDTLEPKTPPQPTKLTNTATLTYMRKQQMTSDGATQTEWLQYQQAVEMDAAALDKDEIGTNGQPEEPSTALVKKSASPGVEGAAPPAEDVEEPVNVLGTDDVNTPHFGNYAVWDLEFTSYKEVFKELLGGIPLAPSRRGLYRAKLTTFIMTRQLIASYFNYLLDIPATLRGGVITHIEAGEFTETLNAYITDVTKRTITGKDQYVAAVELFDAMLSDNANFAPAREAYRCFVQNFKYLSNAPYGYVLTVERGASTWYLDRDMWYVDFSNAFQHPLSKWNDPVTTGRLAERSCRVIPIVFGKDSSGPQNAEGQAGISFIGYFTGRGYASCWVTFDPFGSPIPEQWRGTSPPSARPLWKFVEDAGDHTVLRAESLRDFAPWNNQLNVVWDSRTMSDTPSFDNKWSMSGKQEYTRIPFRLRPVDFKDVETANVHGTPMWYEFPFDVIKASALNGFDEVGGKPVAR